MIAVGAQVVRAQGIDHYEEHVGCLRGSLAAGKPLRGGLELLCAHGVCGRRRIRGGERALDQVVRFPVALRLQIGPAEIVEHLRITGVAAGGAFEEFDSAIALGGLARQREAEIVQRLRFVGLETEHLFVLSSCLGGSTEAVERRPPVKQHAVRGNGIELKGPLEELDRLARSAEHSQDDRVLVEPGRRVGRELGRPPILRLRLLELALSREGVTPGGVGFARIGVSTEYVLGLLDRLRVTAAHCVGTGHALVRGQIVGRQRERPLELGNALGDLPLLEKGLARRDVCARAPHVRLAASGAERGDRQQRRDREERKRSRHGVSEFASIRTGRCQPPSSW